MIVLFPLDMEQTVILYLMLILPSLIQADFTFTHYNDHLLRLRKFGIVEAHIVTSLSKCERHCIEYKNGCQAANVWQIRKGLYSCELISDIAFTTPVDLKPANGGSFIQKTGNDLVK